VADTFQVDGISYETTSDTTCSLIQGIDSAAIAIPQEVTNLGQTYTVTAIGENAFYGCSHLTNVELPGTIQSIGDLAFYSAGLQRIEIPSSVLSIGRYAFRYCTSLINVQIHDGITSIEEGTFYFCRSLDSISIPNSVTTIGDYAFSESGITTLELPSSVTTLGNFAFEYCTKLNSIVIPKSITAIANGCFLRCSNLKEIQVESENSNYQSLDGVLFNKDLTTLCFYPTGKADEQYTVPHSVTAIAESAFYGCSGLQSIEIPGSVFSIGRDAFGCCTNLSKVDIPDGTTSIEDGTFLGCHQLGSILIPNSVTKIGDDAFYGCESLASLDLPDALTTIGDYAFASCSYLGSIVIPKSITTIGEGCFYDCSNLKEIQVESGNSSYQSLDGVLFNKDLTTLCYYPDGKENEQYTVPNTVTAIDTLAFSANQSLQTIQIPAATSQIKENAFENCNQLQAIQVETENEHYRSVDGVLFDKELKTIYVYPLGKIESQYIIPSSVTTIGAYAFYNNTHLNYVMIPELVTSIRSYAFGYTNLRTIEIRSSVATIGDWAFYYCRDLRYFVCYATSPIETAAKSFNTFYTRFCTLYVPEESIEAYRSSSYSWSNFKSIKPLSEYAHGLPATVYDDKGISYYITVDGVCSVTGGIDSTAVTIPQEVSYLGQTYTVTKIGNSTFLGCSHLTSIELPGTIESIGSSAFSNSGLKSVEIPSSVTSIGSQAFYNCSDLKKVEILCSVASIGSQAFDCSYNVTTVVCYATEPIVTEDLDTFANYKLPTLYVPGESIDAYKNSTYSWRYFMNIKPLSEYTDIPAVRLSGVSTTPDGIYDLNGARVRNDYESLAPGIYMMRQGDKSRKILVK
jgi:hypothetical protein